MDDTERQQQIRKTFWANLISEKPGNLNISRYVSTSEDEVQIELNDVNNKLTSIKKSIKTNTGNHNDT